MSSEEEPQQGSDPRPPKQKGKVSEAVSVQAEQLLL